MSMQFVRRVFHQRPTTIRARLFFACVLMVVFATVLVTALSTIAHLPLDQQQATDTPVIDARGEITHFIAIKQDITDRKRAEHALHQAHDELEHRVQERTARSTRAT